VTRAWLLRRLVGDGRRHGAVWLVLVLAFGVVGFAAAGARLVARAATTPVPAPEARVIAYLNDDLDGPGIAELQRVLATLPGVEAVRVVSAREGLELLRRELGPRAAVIDGVGPDLLPSSLEIVARPAEAASALAFRLRRLRGVADVDLVSAASPAAAGAWPWGLAARPWARVPVGGSVALGGTLGLLAIGAAFALLRARFRAELGLLFTLGLTRAASARPALWLATLAGAAGAALGGLAASWASRAWLGGEALPLREAALGATVLVAVAFVAALGALRIPEASVAR
jgi:cell division transport system permease protein